MKQAAIVFSAVVAIVVPALLGLTGAGSFKTSPEEPLGRFAELDAWLSSRGFTRTRVEAPPEEEEDFDEDTRRGRRAASRQRARQRSFDRKWGKHLEAGYECWKYGTKNEYVHLAADSEGAVRYARCHFFSDQPASSSTETADFAWRLWWSTTDAAPDFELVTRASSGRIRIVSRHLRAPLETERVAGSWVCSRWNKHDPLGNNITFRVK